MTTPSGTISLNDVNVELGLSGTTLISMNQTNVRTLAGVPSGAISMNDLRGKSNRVSLSYTFSSNTANASLNLSSISGYSSGKSDITVTINNGIYLYATSTGGYGLNLSGGTTGDTLTIVNNGFIMGQGGSGNALSGGSPGGPAINFGFGMSGATVTNTSGYIGGGGGAGGSLSNPYSGGNAGGGGGAGGGTGGEGGSGWGGYGGSGGSIGNSGANGTAAIVYYAKGSNSNSGGGGGGRIMPGSGGAGGPNNTDSNGRGGGAGGGGAGGRGYGAGASGGSGGSGGGTAYYGAGGGGGYGASGGTSSAPAWSPTSGGNGGKAINLNGKSITWTSGSSSSSRAYGAVS